jgi:CubicO group peptidase (beta-lactamase class C family)
MAEKRGVCPLCVRVLLVALVFRGALPAQHFNRSPVDISATLEPIVERTRIPGMAAVVLRGDEVIAQGVAGVRRKGSPERLTLGDKFQMNSATKAMTATLAAMVVEEGKLSWNTTLGDTFSNSVKHMNPEWRQVTLAQLLEHRGGVPNELNQKTRLLRVIFSRGSEVEKRQKITTAILSHKPAYRPGSQYVYSSLGYILVGAMLEKATGISWEELMRQRLWQPLGITSGGFGAPGTPGQMDQPWGHWGRMMVGHPVPPGGFWSHLNTPFFWGPGGNSHMTITDWAKFISLHLRGDPADPNHAEALIGPDSFATMHRAAPGISYEAGWMLFTRPWANGHRAGDTGRAISSQGDNYFWHSAAWVAPEIDFAVLIVINQGGPADKDPASMASEESLTALIQRFAPKPASSKQ